MGKRVMCCGQPSEMATTTAHSQAHSHFSEPAWKALAVVLPFLTLFWVNIVWFPSRLTHDPVAMKWVEAALGTTIIVVIGTLSPFTYKQRALILSGYFLVWEYTVMCRMYSVMLLLTLIYLLRRTRAGDGFIANCALLRLVDNTDMTGVLLSGALLT